MAEKSESCGDWGDCPVPALARVPRVWVSFGLWPVFVLDKKGPEAGKSSYWTEASEGGEE